MSNIPVSVIKKLLKLNICKIKIDGNSMEPTIHQGDIAQVVVADNAEINDVILYEKGDKCVLHRVVDVFDNYVIAKGDNNRFTDNAIEKSKILGKLPGDKLKPFNKRFINVIFNFWDIEEYNECVSLGIILNLTMINQPNVFFKDGLNIAISAYSIDNIVKIRKKSEIWSQKIYIHIGAKISDFECDGFTIYSKFDCVYRSGTFASSYLLSNSEKFLILYGELMSMGGYGIEQK